tara:strand:+ start:46 stop:585 length:540 start_codon:yes stop_codon:yes gene_type:complete
MKITQIKSKLLSKDIISQICEFKMQFWNKNFNSQLSFFKKTFNSQDIHFIIFNKKKIIGYNLLKTKELILKKKIKRKDFIYKKNFYLFDSFLVNKKFRNQKIGSSLIKVNNEFIKKKKKFAILICKKKLINFYKKYKWCLLCKNSNIKIVNYKLTKNLMCFNLSKKLYNTKSNSIELHF